MRVVWWLCVPRAAALTCDRSSRAPSNLEDEGRKTAETCWGWSERSLNSSHACSTLFLEVGKRKHINVRGGGGSCVLRKGNLGVLLSENGRFQ